MILQSIRTYWPKYSGQKGIIDRIYSFQVFKVEDHDYFAYGPEFDTRVIFELYIKISII